MPTPVDFSRPVVDALLTLTAALQPIGLSHLVAVTAALTPDAASPDAIRRAIEHLADADIIRRHPLPTEQWCSPLRKVVTTGGLWGCDTRFPTYGVPRGPFFAQYNHDVVRGHLIMSHRLAVALATNERVLADMAWLDAARLAAPRIAGVDRLSVSEGLVDQGDLPVRPGTLLGLVTTEFSSLLFGGHWTGPLGVNRLERVTRACWPITLAHPDTVETAWVRKAGRRLGGVKQYAKSRVLPMGGSAPDAWAAHHTAMLACCRSGPAVEPTVLAKSVATLLQWRQIPLQPGHFTPLVHRHRRAQTQHVDGVRRR